MTSNNKKKQGKEKEKEKELEISMPPLLLLSTNNYKTLKGEKKGYVTAVLHFAPHNLAGADLPTVCPYSTPGCRAGCLYYAGHGKYPACKRGRIRKTRLFWENRPLFLSYLMADLHTLQAHCKTMGAKLAVRLNATSDIDWLRIAPQIFPTFPCIQFYDYTKDAKRLRRKLPPNYHLVFSRSECTRIRQVRGMIKKGINVAVVFDNIPKIWQGLPVINGDKDDLRFLEPTGVIVGLTPKGRMRDDKSGFVVVTRKE